MFKHISEIYTAIMTPKTKFALLTVLSLGLIIHVLITTTTNNIKAKALTPEQMDKAVIEHNNQFIIPTIYDNCEYLIYKSESGVAFTHKGNCKNHTHE